MYYVIFAAADKVCKRKRDTGNGLYHQRVALLLPSTALRSGRGRLPERERRQPGEGSPGDDACKTLTPYMGDQESSGLVFGFG